MDIRDAELMKASMFYINVACFLLLALWPSFFSIYSSASSTTSGLLAATVIVFLILLRYDKFVKIPVNWAIILIGMLLWILLIIPGVGGVQYPLKSYLSLLIAIFLWFFVFFIETWFEKCDNHTCYRLMQRAWIILAVIGWLGFFFKIRLFGYAKIPRSIFPFSEPSHFAIVAGPIYMAAFFLTSNKTKLFILINIVFQAMLFHNLSLFVYAVLIALIACQIRMRKTLIPILFTGLILSILVGVFIENPVYMQYCANRLTLSSKDNKNLTSLVVLQGIYAARDSLIDTGGVGLGFQMLGTEKPNKITKIITTIMNGIELSRPEGGFIAAKLIAELGVVGILLTGFAFMAMLRSFFWLRQYWRMHMQVILKRSNSQLKLVIAHSLIVGFFVEMFLRGIGYFSLGVIFFIFSLLYVRRYNQSVINDKAER